MAELDNRETIDIDGAAQRLGVSKQTIRRRMRAGEIKPLPESYPLGAKVSPKLLFLLEDVDKLAIHRQ